MASSERIFEVLDTRPEIEEPEAAVVLKPIKGDVRFEDVWFSYATEEGGEGPPVLKSINLHAEPGETIALLGATGTGKSTLVSLIPRFYDVDRGRVLVDGHDVRELDLKTLRRQIGIVLQETFLFSASLRENIAYGRTDASIEEIEAAAKAARIHDFIVSLPQGYESNVGERGVGLSGGQKQRVAIARALLMDPRILILDDSTSSVDAETEHLIQQALREVMRSRTTFVIAQRLSTVKDANKIVVLDRGEIVQVGTHEDLLQQRGIYREIYELQLKGQEELGKEYVEKALRRVVE
jgi:ATP-binding cassette subfamily B protein